MTDYISPPSQALREQFARDPHRPRYHFLAPAGWLNDPNGLIKWNDEYHLFYQHNPHGAFHGTIHWGHAVSRDLVHWEHLPIALAPTPGGPDADGCWSGCALDHDGTPTLIYTGLRAGKQRPCLATSTDGFRTWQKDPHNPLIDTPPPGLRPDAFRDHCVWREDDTWYQIIGSGTTEGHGVVLLYRSPDLHNWEFVRPLLSGQDIDSPVFTGTVWECPQLLLWDGGRSVLVISIWNEGSLLYTVGIQGSYGDQRFVPERIERLDGGNKHFYAPQTLNEPGGRKLIWGWAHEARPDAVARAAGWAGTLSLPRVFDLAEDGTPRFAPAPELAALRQAHTARANMILAADDEVVLDGWEGDSAELLLDVDLHGAASFELAVRRAPDGSEQTVIGYDRDAQQLFVDRQRASLDEQTERNAHSGSLILAPGEPLQLRVFLDRSIIEVFANGRTCITSRIYPTRPDSQGVAVLARGGSAQLRSFERWQLASSEQDG